METFWSVVVILALVALGIWGAMEQAKQAKREAERDAELGVLASFAGLKITSTQLIEGTGSAERQHSISGLIARVEDSGTLNRRLTATRMVTLGVFALAAPKKQDDRVVYLTVEGPDVAITREVKMFDNANAGVKAREFAQQVNRLAKVGASPAAALPASTTPIQEPAAAAPPPFVASALVRSDLEAPSAGPAAPPAPVAAPGWHPDGHGDVRWFDGYAWTESVRAKPTGPHSAPS